MVKVYEIVFRQDDGNETKVSPCHESWEQYGGPTLDSEMLDAIFQIFHEYNLFRKDEDEEQ